MPWASTSIATATYGPPYNPVSYGSNYYSAGSASTSMQAATASTAPTINENHSNGSTDARAAPAPPTTMSQLSAMTMLPETDTRLPLKALLRSADHYRMKAQQSEREGDIEGAFVSYGIAAKYALEMVPVHKDYNERLSLEQRAALEKNGERILERISILKDGIIARQEEYKRRYGEQRDALIPEVQSAAPQYSSASQQASAKHRDAVLQSARQAASSDTYKPPKTHKDTVLDGARAAASSVQPGSSHTIVQAPKESAESRRRAQQDEFRRREEQILERKRKAQGQQPAPLSSHGSMPSMPAPSNPQPLSSHATMPSISSTRNPLPEPPSMRLLPQVSIPVPSISMYQSQTSNSQPSSSNQSQYSSTSLLQPQSTGSSQYTGTSGLLPQFTGTSTTSVSTQPSSRPPAQIPPQFQLPPMPPPAVYTPFPPRLNGPRPSEANANKEASTITRPITDSGALTPQRQAPRPPIPTAPAQSQITTPIRGSDRAYPRTSENQLSEQFAQMGLTNSQSHSSSAQSTPQPQLMPLESPTKYGYEGDSTDSETVSRDVKRDTRREHRRGDARGEDSSRYPPPITTTSPPPPDLPVTLMTTHQKAQGYHPSLNSMFCAMQQPSLNGSSLLYDAGHESEKQHHHSFVGHHQPSSQVSSSSSRQVHHDVSRSLSIQWESRADAAHGHSRPRDDERDREPTRLESGRVLKTVYVPRACLHRFNAIAKANTLVNKETCGLLLGKDNRELTRSAARKRDAYVVTTLLIPKQHATSDTCAMEEEEGVLTFTVERGLITLGWIHTHPTQTCFMSSVDLHTHSGFQCMLPESFAVVCAPRQKPNYGIFRLTDPVGLQTVLQCNVKAAFHPHPDVPIYTDADRGHVVMKDDMPLEIVDLR